MEPRTTSHRDAHVVVQRAAKLQRLVQGHTLAVGAVAVSLAAPPVRAAVGPAVAAVGAKAGPAAAAVAGGVKAGAGAVACGVTKGAAAVASGAKAGAGAVAPALGACVGGAKAGGSYVAVRRWRHNFRGWDTLTTDQQDALIGRRISDNEEIDDAPESAHFKRTAQESFEPEAFILRRSMPYAAGPDAGLMFVAFGCFYAAFEAQLGRMYGRDDGIQDGLMAISDPLELAYFWCPPLVNGTLGL